MGESPRDACATCGHERSQHIYHEGACRPGFVCPKGCVGFNDGRPRRVNDPLRDAIWTRLISERDDIDASYDNGNAYMHTESLLAAEAATEWFASQPLTDAEVEAARTEYVTRFFNVAVANVVLWDDADAFRAALEAARIARTETS